MAAKKSKNDSGSTIIGALAIAIAIVYYMALAALAMVPFVFLIYGLVSIFLFRGQADQSLIRRNFWLTKQEQKEFIELNSTFCFYTNKRDRAWDAVDREGIRINKDGGISQRSYRGQDLRGAINESEENIKILTPQLERIKKIPQKNWKRVRRHFSNRIAMPVSLCIGLIVGPFRVESKSDQAENTKTTTSEIVSKKTNSVKTDSSQKKESAATYYLASIGTVSVITWIFCWGIMATAYRQKYPKPDNVTIHNVSAN